MLESNTWLMVPQPKRGADWRMFCLPAAGGSAAPFARWAQLVPEDVEIAAMQMPGRGRRLFEPPVTRVEPVVGALAEALWPHVQQPYLLFGHSMGALIAFELARHLRVQAANLPAALIVAGCEAPHFREAGSPVHQLPRKDFVDHLRSYGGTPEEVLTNTELMDLMLPALRADFELVHGYSYRPEPPLPCPIIALGGTEDEHVSREGLLAWRDQTSSAFQVHMLPGGHFFVHENVAPVIRTIEGVLWSLTASLQP